MEKLEQKLQCKCNHCHSNAHQEDKEGKSRLRRQLIRTGVAIILFLIGLIFNKTLRNTPNAIGQYLVFFLAYLLVGGPILWKAGKNILTGKIFNEFFLMSIATIGAIFIDQLAEAVGVMIFFTVGELLQEIAVSRSRRSILDLLNLRPDFARIVTDKGVEIVDPESVEIKQIVLIQPGEKVPLDGHVVEGSSFVDTAALTGESVPRRVDNGDPVLSGMINGSGLLKIKVSKKYNESSLAKIMHLIEEASERKAPTERLISRFAAWYTPIVVISAFLLALLPPLLIPGATFSTWLYRALVLLVISCPCALVLSIPLGYFGGIGGASRQGILIKGANILDELTKINTVVLDKTGTLTEGIFAVQKILPLNNFTEEDVLYWAAQGEIFSNHPIAESILQAYGKSIGKTNITSYQEIKGAGIKATINGRYILVGSHRLLDEENIPYEKDNSFHTIVYVAIDGILAGSIGIADQIKKEAQEAIKSLRHLDLKKIFMLTGDREKTAAHIASQLGLDGYYAELLPEEKVAFVKDREQNNQEKVLFAGDGFNDAPVLMHSSVGVAMGALGTDAAIEAADIVLMDDNPQKIASAIKLAFFTKKIIKQNIIFSLSVKAFFAVTGTMGLASMWWAVFADVGLALLAVLNSTRTLGFNKTTSPVQIESQKIKEVCESSCCGH